MIFKWDEAKRLANIRKHGIDFVECESIFDNFTVTVEDDRFDYGEQRFVTFGLLEGRVVSVVHTETPEAIRIVSIRKASKREQALYYKTLKD
ncbi:MAG: BrnT family toxin [Gammaproteobacteria bacterium]